MAQQEEGWPLGLQPLNLRIGLGNRSRDGSTSFNTSLSDSLTSSTDSSSDLDTESTGSFFHDRSTTLGSLIGVNSIINLSRRSTRGIRPNGVMTEVQKNNYRSKTTAWCFSLCPRNSTDAKNVMMIRNSDSNAPSLGHFLAVERRAANEHNRRSHHHSPLIYGPDEFAMALPNRDQNSLFANGQIAPPQLSPWSSGSDDIENRQRTNRELDHDAHGQGAPLLFPCMCG
ncbi:uncharacterized protein At3g17950-like [Lycium barbarum]|uniref:uncharacterized protein At3g17950-like n=1 Tax=Lycium barbarum TaxID=112863 RepID=UPI00293E2591|nr:uncharacterized protein At3g17950-like [Lycium barbarum]